MSNQPAPTRPWFRLASISRPAPTPTPEPLPPPAPPRPAATVRPAFRQTVQAQPPPPAGGVSSVPTSPVSVGRASQPSSPADKKTTSSVPNSPVKTVPTATAAGPAASPPKTSTTAAGPTTSPPKTSTTASVPSSPAKLVGTTTTTSVPTSPAKTAPTTTSVTSSPIPKPVSSVITTTRVPNPKSDKLSPIQSPKIKPPTAPPPSPLTLPPSQLRAQAAELEPKIPVEPEQKTVVVQKTIEKPRGSWVFGGQQKDGGDTRKPSNIPLNEQKAKDSEPTKEKVGHGKKFPSRTEDDGTSVITLAGENKGAFMELIRSPHKTGFQGSPNHIQKGNTYRIGSDGSDYQSYGSSSGEEGDGKMKEKSKTPSRTMAPMNVFMNSNVQGINNSILYNSSCTHHNPGVLLSLYTKPARGGFHVKERTKGYSS